MPTVTARRGRALAAASLAAAVALTACNSDSGSTSTAAAGNDSVLGKAASAMAEASGVARVRVTLGSGTSAFTSRWQGTLAKGRGIASGRLPGTGDPALDARWTGGNLYVHRTTDAEQYGSTPVGQLTSVRPDTALWATVPASQAGSLVFTPLSPPDLVRALSTNGAQRVSDGPRIGGVPTRKVTVTRHVGLLMNWTVTGADVYLDGRDHARRIVVTAGAQGVRVEISYSGTVPTVQPPSAADLAARTPPPPAPIGPFLAVRSGTDSGVTWTLQKAPGRTGTECWRWEGTPAQSVVKPNYQTDTRCVAPMAPTGPDTDPADQVDVVLWTDGTRSPAAAVVARFPDSITQATLGFVGGRTETVPVSGGLLTWVGPSSEPLGYVGLHDGATAITCGVGAVSSIGDLSNDTLTGDPFFAPWSCQSS